LKFGFTTFAIFDEYFSVIFGILDFTTNLFFNHYSKGDVKISPRGSLCIGRLTAQREGGDAGRDSANMLQFKFNPLELFD
jgi:R.HinP1I restriction endonuclease